MCVGFVNVNDFSPGLGSPGTLGNIKSDWIYKIQTRIEEVDIGIGGIRVKYGLRLDPASGPDTCLIRMGHHLFRSGSL